MSESLKADIKRRQASARGDRIALPFADITETFKVSWSEPDPRGFKKFDELDDVKDELDAWLPLGKADGQCIMAALEAPHRVAVFMETFWPLAESLERFFGETLIAKGAKSLGQKVSAAVDKAQEKLDDDKPEAATKILREALSTLPAPPDPNREDLSDLEELVSDAWNLLGVAEHEAGDDERSLEAYEKAQLWNRNAISGGNILRILVDAKRCAEAVSIARSLLAEFATKVAIDDEATLRSQLFIALVHLGKGDEAEAELSAWAVKQGKRERAACRKELLEDLPDAGLASRADAVKKILA